MSNGPRTFIKHARADNGSNRIGFCEESVRFSHDLGWLDVDSSSFLIEIDIPAYKRKQRVVSSDPHPFTRVPFCSALTDQNVARHNQLTAKFFDSKSFGLGITTVTTGPLSLLMCHAESPSFRRTKKRTGTARAESVAETGRSRKVTPQNCQRTRELFASSCCDRELRHTV